MLPSPRPAGRHIAEYGGSNSAGCAIAGGAAQARAEHDRLARRALEDVVGPDAAMGHAARLQVLEHVRRRAKHAFQQLRLRPGS